jgi:hypothetical protein
MDTAIERALHPDDPPNISDSSRRITQQSVFGLTQFPSVLNAILNHWCAICRLHFPEPDYNIVVVSTNPTLSNTQGALIKVVANNLPNIEGGIPVTVFYVQCAVCSFDVPDEWEPQSGQDVLARNPGRSRTQYCLRTFIPEDRIAKSPNHYTWAATAIGNRLRFWHYAKFGYDEDEARARAVDEEMRKRYQAKAAPGETVEVLRVVPKGGPIRVLEPATPVITLGSDVKNDFEILTCWLHTAKRMAPVLLKGGGVMAGLGHLAGYFDREFGSSDLEIVEFTSWEWKTGKNIKGHMRFWNQQYPKYARYFRYLLPKDKQRDAGMGRVRFDPHDVDSDYYGSRDQVGKIQLPLYQKLGYSFGEGWTDKIGDILTDKELDQIIEEKPNKKHVMRGLANVTFEDLIEYMSDDEDMAELKKQIEEEEAKKSRGRRSRGRIL